MYFTSTTIEIFLSVARTHSFTRTAEELYMSQQAVSKRVADFEKACDCKLFNRTTRSVNLTESGMQLFTIFAKAESELTQALRDIHHKEAPSLVFRIGIPLRFDLTEYISRSLTELERVLPGASVTFVHQGGKDMVKPLDANQLDAIISFRSPLLSELEGLSSWHITDAQRLLLVAKTHPKATPTATVQDFENEILYLYRNENTEDDASEIDNFYRTTGDFFSPKRIKILPSEPDARLAVEMGEGVTISSSCDAITHTSTLVGYPLGTTTPVFLFWTGHNPNPYLPELIHSFTKAPYDCNGQNNG